MSRHDVDTPQISCIVALAAVALSAQRASLTTEIRDGLPQTIEKIVVRAVSQELAHLQTLKK